MTTPLEQPAGHCIFAYLYRDGGNYKTHGELLLAGTATEEATATIASYLEIETLFVAKQIGVPSLCLEHFAKYDGPTDLDHAFHEFAALRPATDEQAATLPLFSSLDELIRRIEGTGGNWNVRLSPNCGW
jgi:hypothetical protein